MEGIGKKKKTYIKDMLFPVGDSVILDKLLLC